LEELRKVRKRFKKREVDCEKRSKLDEDCKNEGTKKI
jgi:hypothetical protein